MAVIVWTATAGRLPAAENGGEYSLRNDLPFWGTLTFLVFLWVCWKLLWNWWRGSMGERELTEAERIAAAEAESRTAAELLSDRIGRLEAVDSEIREILAEARRDAEYTRGHILEAAQSEAEAARRRAVREIDRTREQSLKEIFDQMTSRTIERTRDLLSRRLAEPDQRRLISEALTNFRQQAS
ncbi:MAG TPA: ATP synthase F0 subunit B [Planctomycetaceae bacterium]|nr:ATP synthase F0 subunit B [Planctomycetaceae bacterium]